MQPVVHRRAKRGLSSWVAASLVAAVLLTASLLYALTERLAAEHATHEANAALEQIAWQMRDQLDRDMSHRCDEIAMLAGMAPVEEGTDADAIRRLLERIQSRVQSYAWIGFARSDGTVVAANAKLLEGANVGQRPWFRAGLRGPFIGDVHGAALLETMLPKQAEPWRFVDIAVPVVVGGQTKGVLGAHLSWEWARDLRRDLLAPASRDFGIEVFIVEDSGKVLLGPASLEGTTLAIDGLPKPGRGAGPAGIEVWPDAVRYATAFATTRGTGDQPGLGWTVVVRQPEATALASLATLRNRMIVVSLLICALAALVAPLVGRRLARPLRRLAQSLERPLDGNDAMAMSSATSYREADQLAAALHAMRRRVASHAEQLEALNVSLEQRVAQRTRELSEREADRRAVIDQASEAFIRIGADGRIVEWNAQASATFGWQPDEALGRTYADLMIPARLRRHYRRQMAEFLATGEAGILNRRGETRALRRDGSEITVEFIVGATPHGDSVSFNVFMHDIGRRKRAEQVLRESRETLRTVANNVPALVALFDRDLRYAFANETYREWYGIGPEELIGASLVERLGDSSVQALRPRIDSVLAGERVSFELRMVVRGSLRHTAVTFVPQRRDAEVTGFFAVVFDVTERKELELALASEARHDALTALPNRRRLMEELPLAMARADRTRKSLALLFLDLNGFKAINDTHGHQAGDLVLREVATRLTTCVRKTDVVARLAGDEFVILLESMGGETTGVDNVIAKTRLALAAPFMLDGETGIAVSASIGCKLYAPGDEKSAEQLLSGADADMYRVKRAERAGQLRVVSG